MSSEFAEATSCYVELDLVTTDYMLERVTVVWVTESLYSCVYVLFQSQARLLCSLLTEIIISRFVFFDVVGKKVIMNDQWILMGWACVATYVKTREFGL